MRRVGSNLPTKFGGVEVLAEERGAPFDLVSEGAVTLDKLPGRGVAFDEQGDDAVGDRHVALGLELHIAVGVGGRSGSTSAQIDQLHSLATAPSVDEAREQHWVHLSGVVSPENDRVGVVEVVVAARWLVDTVGADESRHRRGHAEPRVGVDVVDPETTLGELLCGVAFGDSPLTAAVIAKPLGMCADSLGGDIERLVPGDRDLHVAAPEQGLGQPVASIEREPDVITLDAEQAAVDRCLTIASD